MSIKTFKQLSKKDVKTAGGKGASLGELTRAGFLVPPGFVILASAFEEFIKETDINSELEAMWERINIEDMENVEENSEIIRDVILKKKFPKDLGGEILLAFDKLGEKEVIVRSSATAEDSKIDAWAGQLESYFYITRKNLLEHIQKCWASLYTPRALFYRVERNMHRKDVSVAVVVQKMINSEVAGVCFTVHPVTQDKNQMIIEAVLGLGESLVQGTVTPDSYTVRKFETKSKSKIKNSKHLEILDKNIQNKQILNSKQIKELAETCLKIEKHYKNPQDIEWAFEKRKFHIVQSRPITTL